MINWRIFSGWFPKLACGLLLAPVIGFAARPNPPSQVCVDEVCASQPDPTPSAGKGLQWHPGHYVWHGGFMRYNSSTISQFNSFVDSICKNTNIKGVQLAVWWGSLEGSSAGDYTSGFKYTDQILAKLQSCDKQLMIHLKERGFGGPHGSDPSVAGYANSFPAYLMTSKYGACCSGGNLGGVVGSPAGASWTGSLKSIARVWKPDVTDRLIALVQAYGARYDSHPNFEMFSVGETAIGAPESTGFSGPAYYAQYKRFLTAATAAFPHTVIRFTANWVQGDGTMNDLIAHCASLDYCAVGGPDPELPLPNVTKTESNRTTQSNRSFRGVIGTDFRGKIPWVGEVQDCGTIACGYSYTPAQIWTHQRDYMRAKYMIWNQNAIWSPTLSFINSIGGKLDTSCPSNYENRCTSD